MVKPFPIRESSLFGLAEAVSRVLGLLFLARFVTGLGLTESAALRMTLPLLSMVAAFCSIGLPQALTRLFAAATASSGGPIPRSLLITLRQAILCAAVLTLLAWWLLDQGAVCLPLFSASLGLPSALATTVPLLLLMCVTGSLRGALLGLGSTYAPALAQVIEVVFRLLALVGLLPVASKALSLSGAQLGIVTLTVGEAASALFLGAMLFLRLRLHGVSANVSATRSDETAPTQAARLFTVLRMSLATTGQALVASLGYALELPVAQVLLRHSHGPLQAAQLIAEYSAIALPLLCAPMVLTDGMAQAILPLTASVRAAHGVLPLALYLRRVIGAVAMVALPVTGALVVLAPVLGAWYGAPSAGSLLILLSPLALPLYLQAPLAAWLQAQGYSRGLLYAGLVGDAARIGGLLLWLGAWQMGSLGLALSLACSVCLQTAMLGLMTRRRMRWSVPWRTLWRSAQAACTLMSLLLIGLHAPGHWRLAAHPLPWLIGAGWTAAFYLLLAGEITPHHLARLPWVGRSLRKISEPIAKQIVDR